MRIPVEAISGSRSACCSRRYEFSWFLDNRRSVKRSDGPSIHRRTERTCPPPRYRSDFWEMYLYTVALCRSGRSALVEILYRRYGKYWHASLTYCAYTKSCRGHPSSSLKVGVQSFIIILYKNPLLIVDDSNKTE